MTAFCCLCGSTNQADLGQHIGICLDRAACHGRKAARMNAKALAANPDIGVVTVGLEDLRAVLADAWALTSNPAAFNRLAEAAGLVR